NTYSSHTAMISRGELYFSLPTLQNELGLKIKLNPTSLETFYPGHDRGEDVTLKENQAVVINGYQIKFEGFNKSVAKEKYASQEGDIAVSTMLQITTPTGTIYPVAPIFIIRNSQIQLVHDFIFDEQIRLSCIKIDPATESILVRFYKAKNQPVLDIDIAEKAPRNDLIVIQSILFPGINLFWLGALTMLGGVLLSGIRRWIV
ncbi:MAG: hypothetical protein ABIR66_13775, partial [Saprospiraceae bacterium]